jgi:proline dehydrogenase
MQGEYIANQPVDFHNLEIAFSGKSNGDLTRAYWLFRAMGNNFLVRNSQKMVDLALALRLPVITIIRKTIYRHFCGGETISECNNTISALWKSGIGSVLDYSVEGDENEANFEHTTKEIMATIDRAKGDPSIPFCVFKVTGIAGFHLLERVATAEKLSMANQKSFDNFRERVSRICTHAASNDVRVFIDAEESWIQQPVDDLADEMMEKHNKEKAIVYNTVQLYRHDRLEFLKASHRKAKQRGYILGVKLVRGAYMEKERERAAAMGYPSPIQPDHAATNRDYDASLEYSVRHLPEIALCAGTHNEKSCLLLTDLMKRYNIESSDTHIWFSQLLGMSDHISYNLAHAGYNVAKYVPYGPVRSVLPYLIRRAMENTSIAGQTGRELRMLTAEKNRRAGKS